MHCPKGLAVKDVPVLKSEEPKGRPGPKPDPARARPASTMLRSSEDWKTWLAELASYDRGSTVADLLDRAVVSYAREIKFPKPAPKR